MVNIKRRVIQIANSTQLISLPRKWSLKYGIKKGDELEVEEQGNKLSVGVNNDIELKIIEIDISGLDRTTILYYLQSLYRIGYDEIKILFSNHTTTYFRENQEVSVIKVINQEVNRLLGYEVIQQRDNYCLIKDISTSSVKEFDSVLRRVFLLIKDASSDLIRGSKENNINLLSNIEEKHDSITKFISYCSRLLNKYGYSNNQDTIVLYHIIGDLDKVIDVLKNTARDATKFKHSLNTKTIQLIQLVDDTIQTFSEFFYKFDPKKAVKMYKNRNDMMNLLYSYKNKIPVEELILVSKIEHIFELVTDMQVARMGMKE